ncbi:hypothetical protein LTR35_016333 [Friedmanniomyces endolithicus]|uniref:Uncharacterized protein n=1 Tax=Friedmanniomyces endolithicus TaxID=329885 RepID=A0AAN6JDJ3_9PEZI|nr:hypothetical protein LTR35_016333 [Friedmanniomyces endolithicus]KAK0295705.1 hypothetical protein LTS00_005907 [Friedmanniomyces endolithicus]KAK0326338.1 hypothetical protein LTR82_002178 [Friedmanniomyces endolithicus]KAK0976784.1 hypothetical protein LTR54_016411 [Friedmanniomyces endolithicus]
MASSGDEILANWDFKNLRRAVDALEIEFTNLIHPSWGASQMRRSTENFDKARVKVQEELNKINDSALSPDNQPGQDGFSPAAVMSMRKLRSAIKTYLHAPTAEKEAIMSADVTALVRILSPNHPFLKGKGPVAADHEQTVGNEESEETEQPKDAGEAPELAKEVANSDQRGHMNIAA